jgi:N6-L-threonylcarbamoyladenine synthase
LGKTRDDAAGEAYDKVAKLLGFGYPGGPVLDQLAVYGNPDAIALPMAKMKGNALDFSFSGLKTAVLRWVQSQEMADEIAARRELLKRNPHPSPQEWLEVTPQATLDVIAAFQRVVVEELLKRVERAADETGARSVIISGGVACNAGLRRAAHSGRLPCRAYFPTPHLSTDNAAMIAAAAWPKFERGEFDDLSLKAQANLALA